MLFLVRVFVGLSFFSLLFFMQNELCVCVFFHVFCHKKEEHYVFCSLCFSVVSCFSSEQKRRRREEERCSKDDRKKKRERLRDDDSRAGFSARTTTTWEE